MTDLADMLWAEACKALRSRMPLWTALASLLMPLSISFLIFVSRNPGISQKLGLVGAKANLVAYSGTDWAAFMGLLGQMIAAGGFIFFVLVISWTFGREFSDGTMKELLAVPIHRSSILLAKFLVVAIWCAALAIIMYLMGLVMGAVLNLPGGSLSVISRSSLSLLIGSLLTIVVILPFAFFASAGRGYLLPIGVALLTLMFTNLVAVLGWGDYFPWAIPGLAMMGKAPLTPGSLCIVLFTGLAGMGITYGWWKYADQNR